MKQLIAKMLIRHIEELMQLDIKKQPNETLIIMSKIKVLYILLIASIED